MPTLIKPPSRITNAKSRNVRVIVSSGYYSPSKDCIARVHLVGGGGGGAGGAQAFTQRGAGGGYTLKTLKLKAGVAYNVTVGAGGTGGSLPWGPSGGLGFQGGNTSFMSYDIDPIYAYGGGGGRQNSPSPSEPFAGWGIGGLGFGGDFSVQGQSPGTGPSTYHNQGGPFPTGGVSLSSYFYNSESVHISYGAGGSGGSFVPVNNPWNPQAPGYYSQGGTGGQGLVIVEEFI